MSPISPLAAMGPLLAALAAMFLVGLFIKQPDSAGRYATIDGLRGYLAFLSSCITDRSGTFTFAPAYGKPPVEPVQPVWPEQRCLVLHDHGLLFWTKLLEAPHRPIDWARLFVSRVLRLTPLYLCAMVLVLLTAAILSRGTQVDSAWRMLLNTARWLTFTIWGAPDLNGIRNTFIMTAGVTWSLSYEWLFYLTLPLFAWALGRRPATRYLVLAVIGVLAVGTRHHQSMQLLAFLGGITSATSPDQVPAAPLRPDRRAH